MEAMGWFNAHSSPGQKLPHVMDHAAIFCPFLFVWSFLIFCFSLFLSYTIETFPAWSLDLKSQGGFFAVYDLYMNLAFKFVI